MLLVLADTLTDETIVGKCQLAKSKLPGFKQFAGNLGWIKNPLLANLFFVFTDSERAFHFRSVVQDQCKHFQLSARWVLPWGIDASAKSVWAYSGVPHSPFRAADLEKEIFS